MKHIEIVIDMSTGHFETILGENGNRLSIQEVKDLGIEWTTDKDNWKKHLKIPIG